MSNRSDDIALLLTKDFTTSSHKNCELKYIEFLPCHYCSLSQEVNNYEENQNEKEEDQQDDDKCSQLNKDTTTTTRERFKIHSRTSYYATTTTKTRRRIHRKTFYMDKYELGYLQSQLEKYYRTLSALSLSFSSPPLCQEKENQHDSYVFKVVVLEPAQHYIDHKSNDIVTMFMVERRELEHSLNWLSTLGGAFSALGDNSDEFAERAGKTSKGQLIIAMKLNDPRIMSRCRLYAAISLLQLGNLKSARKILEREWEYAKSLSTDSDPRLKRMCIGIWAKLQYVWKQHHHLNSQQQ